MQTLLTQHPCTYTSLYDVRVLYMHELLQLAAETFHWLKSPVGEFAAVELNHAY
jgi:hypothetical protein